MDAAFTAFLHEQQARLLQTQTGGSLALAQQVALGVAHAAAVVRAVGSPEWGSVLEAQAQAAMAAAASFEARVLPALIGCAASSPNAAMLKASLLPSEALPFCIQPSNVAWHTVDKQCKQKEMCYWPGNVCLR